jgi:hypothetical protein
MRPETSGRGRLRSLRCANLALVLVAQMLHGQEPAIPQHLVRLAEEAEIFARMGPKVIGQETLEQVAAQPPPRFLVRGAKPELSYRTRQIVSEYGFATLQDDQNLHELRNVITVDGRKVKEKGQLRQTLSMGMKGDADRVKKKLVRDFESYGLRESATDFGQAILMFQTRQLPDYNFTFTRNQFVGPDACRVYLYEQKEDGNTAVTVFEGKRVIRHLLKGEIYLREVDNLPVRITIDANRTEGKNILQHSAVVDYQMSVHGVLLPVAVKYAEAVNNAMIVENRFAYTDFKLFGASSELKFTVEDAPPPKKETPPKP